MPWPQAATPWINDGPGWLVAGLVVFILIGILAWFNRDR